MIVLAALGAVAGCGSGGDGGGIPEGPPAGRHGAAAVESLTHTERIRARLTAASNVYALGERDAAQLHLEQAGRLWEARAGAVRRGDRVLAREIDVAFERVVEQMAGAASFDSVRDRLAPLNGQLLDGVREEVAPKDARLDPGVQAAVLVDLLQRLEAEYARGGVAELQHAYGLVVRCQAVARELAGALGPRRPDVVDALRNLRSSAFPDGAGLPDPPTPAEDVARRSREIRGAVSERFALGPG